MQQAAGWDFTRRATGAERFFLHAPISTVVLVARSKGEVTGKMLQGAIRKVPGDLELDRMIMQPGGVFPLVGVDPLISAVTCAGKLSQVLEYTLEAVRPAEMCVVKDQALEYLEINHTLDIQARGIVEVAE